MSNNIAAVIGRPNVGKSTLFNRLLGKKIAIVHDTPGVTRDRNYGEAEWNGKKFFLIDTGGYVPDSKDKFEAAIREQVKISIDEADVILFLVDALSGITPLDMELAGVVRKESGKKENVDKKIILVVNKVDNMNREMNKQDFYKLGLGEPFDVSALVGRRSGDLMDLITENMSDTDEQTETSDKLMKFAVIGRPNVGKSSIVNALTQSDRNIVTDIPGTTRDSIDTVIKYYGEEIVLIDTAGLRKKNKIKKAESLEFYSAIRTQRSIEKCNVAIIVIDASSMIPKLERSSDIDSAVFKLDKEDVNIIVEAARMKKGILVVINKWDLIKKDSETARQFEMKVKEHLKNFDYLPFLFVSALTKQRVSNILGMAVKVYRERCREIKTSVLNAKLNKIIGEFPPRSRSRKEVKINYITQLKTSPPVFGFFTNLPSEIEENYKRFLESKVRVQFGFTGVPLTLVFKRKN
jgi:GTP-binding protein